MKVFIFASVLVVAVSASLQERATQFQSFKVQHGKTYTNQVEEAKRFALFAENVQEIEAHNALYDQGLVTYKKGINKFADWSKDEIKAYLTLHKKPLLAVNRTNFEPVGDVPDSLDWRTLGAVTPIKDQGDCGSCYSFSLTGTLEGIYFLKTGQLVSLSEQQILECTWDINYGCDGGYMEQTFPYIAQYGIESEADYPYKGTDTESCKYDASKVVTKINDYKYFYSGENNLLQATVNIGPPSVAIEATYMVFYESGIYSDEQCSRNPDDLNHGVIVVGYGTEDGVDYWIVKNSWGVNWGENGYIRMRRGTDECGITEDVSYPVID